MHAPVLLQMSVSPWSEKARWALDHHGIAYRRREYTPLADEPGLRLRLRRFRGVASVPVLIAEAPEARRVTFADRQVIEGSLAIARWADSHGSGRPLCDDPAIEEWNARSDRILVLGRSRVLQAMLRSKRALVEALPKFLPDAARGALAPVAALGTWWVLKKYPVELQPEAIDEQIAAELEITRKALHDARGEEGLLGELSFADVAIAGALQVVRPVVHPAYRLGGATIEAWTSERLAERFADLLQWRDALYASHRARVGASAATTPDRAWNDRP